MPEASSGLSFFDLMYPDNDNNIDVMSEIELPPPFSPIDYGGMISEDENASPSISGVNGYNRSFTNEQP
jgi:hypothetical protein